MQGPNLWNYLSYHNKILENLSRKSLDFQEIYKVWEVKICGCIGCSVHSKGLHHRMAPSVYVTNIDKNSSFLLCWCRLVYVPTHFVIKSTHIVIIVANFHKTVAFYNKKSAAFCDKLLSHSVKK